ncbi:MAG: hypothetical protein KGO96_12220 [Elusimicrobia bacterium]|nr:hypothetical protein [Elusimicrobiota bacterium]MDE2426662.1 hypothetical protein [Elusimicrobiota bacterium]
MALQAQQIVTLATQIAGAPGMASQAGQLLNSILSDLCQTYDFDVAKKVTTITLATVKTNYGSGPYTLPADFLRAIRDDVFFTYNGIAYPLTPIDLVEYDQFPQQAGNLSFPSMFATDMSQSPPQLFVWPPPNAAYPLTIRYFSQMPDITTPESSSTVPWFPNTDYLKTRLAGEMMQITDDTRADNFLARAEAILNGYLKMKDDASDRTATVKLDRRRFTPGWAKLPNTKLLGF